VISRDEHPDINQPGFDRLGKVPRDHQEIAMLKTSILALTLTATLAGVAVTASTPASAHDWHGPGYGDRPHWGYDGYRHPHFWHRDAVFVPRGDCTFIWRPAKVWTAYGPRWERQRVEVCD
jgi:hypothetical protein